MSIKTFINNAIKEHVSQKFGIYEKLPKNIFEFLKVYSYFENDFNLVERF